ncbi:maternal effect embryo arrest 18 [Micractinium conductrix]|uniref:Maternal effect embryo arrest 18 n=1 Tax=Micractinium conductrix TaxID=554055 RepID=A0A2P6VAH0_9CHLO|nr:maternal effect embryo arrest 18 [Micractinium conductrix]|eukprot:PSC71096.1 maternal effect embryo arrest 18 [Micractinium conductrix]
MPQLSRPAPAPATWAPGGQQRQPGRRLRRFWRARSLEEAPEQTLELEAEREQRGAAPAATPAWAGGSSSVVDEGFSSNSGSSNGTSGSAGAMERSHLLRMLSVPSASKPLSPAHARGGGAAGLPTLAEQGASLGGEAPPPEPSLVVFSGGTAFNSVAGHMRQLTTRIAHVLPVSDDGGSTAEIVRVLGGPAVGDIRSRCLRLADDSDEEARAVRQLLAHRLSSSDSRAAKLEWYSIVEGEGPLWEGISDAYRDIIRAYLVHFHANIQRHATKRFDYRGGSVGNFFFAGARIFFRSLEAAIFLFSRVARIPEGSLVLPAICTDEHITLGAELADGSLIVGQHQISHPSSTGSPREVDKTCDEELQAPIKRIFYLSAEGDTHEHEVAPAPNPRVLTELQRADAVIYGMGSLYTSIFPSLILRGVGECIAATNVPKIFLLNGALDRETSCCPTRGGPMTAADMVQAAADALNRRASKRTHRLAFPPSVYVSAVLVPAGSPVAVDTAALERLGVRQILEVPSVPAPDGRGVHFEPDGLVAAVATVIAAHRAAAQRAAAASNGWVGGSPAAAGLTRRNSI